MTELMMFTGKGGVGKSTCSTSTAIKFAQDGKKVLLLTDIELLNGLESKPLNFESQDVSWVERRTGKDE